MTRKRNNRNKYASLDDFFASFDNSTIADQIVAATQSSASRVFPDLLVDDDMSLDLALILCACFDMHLDLEAYNRLFSHPSDLDEALSLFIDSKRFFKRKLRA